MENTEKQNTQPTVEEWRFLVVVDQLMYSLECTMASLESLLSRKRSPKFEIRRHEKIIERTFTAPLLKSLDSLSEYRMMTILRDCPRVKGLVASVARGLTAEEAVHAYFLHKSLKSL